MITLQKILSTQSTILDNARVRIIRHKDHRQEYRDVIRDKKLLRSYQDTQPDHHFRDCDYIVSFTGLDRRLSLLFGVFKVLGYNVVNEEYAYKLEDVKKFDCFNDRLIIDWGMGTRSWNQWYHKREKEVVQLLPQGYIGNFPGLLDFVLEFEELRKLIDSPSANHDWYHNLSAVNGIYLILDTHTGKQYIGSANGKDGIWQRWREYTVNGHGGNKLLKQLHDSDAEYHRNFRYSVLQTLPSNITQREIVTIENLYKEKLGSRAHGLNDVKG